MKRLFLLALIFGSFSTIQAQVQASYYVIGSAEDWTLFMSKKVEADLAAGGKVVIITLTASDKGNGSNSLNGSPIPYYLAKERGGVYASKFYGDFYNNTSPNNNYLMPSAQPVTIYGKSMIKYFYGNSSGAGAVVNYFLRLPDGGPSGTGYASTGNKSLKNLKDNGTPITSVDGTATYNTWYDLTYTIYSILFAEKGLDLQVWMNTSNLNTVVNPNDYPDHFYSATAAQDAVATRLWVGINEYIMNYSSNLAANLSTEEYEKSTGAFNMFNWSLVKDRYPSEFTSTVRGWLPMDYTSVKRSPSGNAPLPITLVDFTGSLKGNNVLLEWTTSSEFNSKEFQIERSNDGVNYRKLSTIPAAGTSTSLKKYNYLDIEATDINYYRLRMVDIDNSAKLSNIVLVKNPGLLQSVSAVSNPFRDYISIRFARIPKGETTLKLIDLSGRLISSSKVYNPISSVIRFDYTQALTKGMYILQAETEGQKFSVKLLKD